MPTRPFLLRAFERLSALATPVASVGYRPEDIVMLFATSFAVAVELCKKVRSVDMLRTAEDARGQPASPSLDTALGRLLDPASWSTERTAYLTLVDTLGRIDDLVVLDRDVRDGRPSGAWGRGTWLAVWPSTTELPVLPSLAECSGVVHHRLLRRGGEWRKQRAQAESEGTAPVTYTNGPRDGLRAICAWWDQSLPGASPITIGDVRDHVPDDVLDEVPAVTDAGALLRRGEFRLALCPGIRSRGPLFRVYGGASADARADRFGTHGPEGFTRRHVRALLAAAEEDHVHVLVLPELYGGKGVIEVIEKWGESHALPLLTIAGSAHRPHGATHRNVATIIASGAGRLYEHAKVGAYKFASRHVRAPRFAPDPPPPMQEYLYEDIDRAACLEVFDTSLGTIAVVICADVLDPDGLVPALLDVRPDFVLIPSLSTKTGGFEAFAERAERLGVSTLYVNGAMMRNKKRTSTLAFARLAIPAEKGGIPPHLAYRVPPGRAAPILEAYSIEKDCWKKAATFMRTGGYLHPRLGLVVDLGARTNARASATA